MIVSHRRDARRTMAGQINGETIRFLVVKRCKNSFPGGHKFYPGNAISEDFRLDPVDLTRQNEITGTTTRRRIWLSRGDEGGHTLFCSSTAKTCTSNFLYTPA